MRPGCTSGPNKSIRVSHVGDPRCSKRKIFEKEKATTMQVKKNKLSLETTMAMQRNEVVEAWFIFCHRGS